MPVTAFYNEFDVIANPLDMLKLMGKIFPDHSVERRWETVLGLTDYLRSKLEELKKTSLSEQDLPQITEGLGMGPKMVLTELFKTLTYREVFQWQSNPNQADGSCLIEQLQSGSF